MSVDAPGEFEIISRYFSRSAHRHDVLLGVGDDAAVLAVPQDRRLVAAVDTIVVGVHFPANTAARDIGHRALAVNLSDLAAMGAEPKWALLSLSLPQADPKWLEAFAAGFHDLAAQYGVALVGGDTVRGPLVITVQILGTIETDLMLTRGGARPGDLLYISGAPGEAAAGLALLQADGQAWRTDPRDERVTTHLQQRFLRPEPRIALGRTLRTLATAAMDVSDGLLADLRKLCLASRCAAQIDLESLPVSTELRAVFDQAACERFVLSGGDDYELLFTLPAQYAGIFEAQLGGSVECQCIGRIVGDAPPGTMQCLRDGHSVEIDATGFDHFAAYA